MRKDMSEVFTDFVSQSGAFRVNYDYFSFLQLDNFACWIVADGINSELEKKSAEIVVKYLLNEFKLKPTLSPHLLKKYLQNANLMLQIEDKEIGLSASLVMVVTDYSKMIWASSGNARLYYFSEGQVIFRSKDQSMAQKMLETGKISENDLNKHAERNNLTNYLGIKGDFKPYISDYYYLKDGDYLILCTVGYWENVNNYEIINVIRDNKEYKQIINGYKDLIENKKLDILNNYTVALIYVPKVIRETAKPIKNNLKKILSLLLFLSLLGGIVVVVNQIYHSSKLGINSEVQNSTAIVKQENKEEDYSKLNLALEEHQNNGDKKFQLGDYENTLKEYQAGLLLARKINSFEQEIALQKRVDLISKIIEANLLFEQREYQRALTIYQEVEQPIALIAIETPDLKKRIERTENCIKVIQLIADGDIAFQNKDYQTAKKLYIEAQVLAEKYALAYSKQELEFRFRFSEFQGEDGVVDLEIPVNRTLENAQKLENEADLKYNARDYKAAAQLYSEARRIYQELNENEAFENAKIKQEKSERKVNSFLYRIFRI